jgi:NAD(P)-dependent dehydrogenase (short-subunit alcohol dehydrogenase family)
MTKAVVITGSTRGIGYAMAAAFLEHGCQVTISGHHSSTLDDALDKLRAKFTPERIFGYPCDVTHFSQVQALWEQARQYFGRVDIWINNAGTAAPRMAFWETSPDKYDELVRINVIGTMYGTRVALTGMLAQGFGALYNMEGFGARGRNMLGMIPYGSTKAAVHYINQSLAQEVAGTSLIIGAIAPGMVITDMITRQYVGREAELEKAKPILNIIAERPETVAPVLVEKILNNQKNGVTVTFASPVRILLKFLYAPFKKRDLFSPQG